MKFKLTLIALFSAAALSACMFTAQQKQAAAEIGKSGIDLATQLASQATAAAIETVFSKATDSTDLLKKKDLTDSVAAGIRTLEGTGLVSNNTLKSTILAFSNGALSHWNAYADSLVDKYAASPLPTDQKLEILASSAEVAAHP